MRYRLFAFKFFQKTNKCRATLRKIRLYPPHKKRNEGLLLPEPSYLFGGNNRNEPACGLSDMGRNRFRSCGCLGGAKGRPGGSFYKGYDRRSSYRRYFRTFFFYIKKNIYKIKKTPLIRCKRKTLLGCPYRLCVISQSLIL